MPRALPSLVLLAAALAACEPAAGPTAGCADACSDADADSAGDAANPAAVPAVPDSSETRAEADATAPAETTAPEVDAGAALDECGQASMLADDFEALLPFDRWSTSGGVAAQARNVAGQATIGLGPVPGFGGYFARARVALWSSSLRVEVTRVPDLASDALTTFTLTAGDNALGFVARAGTLAARQTVAGVEHQLGSLPYDPLRHRWWRLRETGYEVLWEVSRDGSTWEVLTTASVAFDLSWLRAELAAGTSEIGTSPGEAAFDNVNGAAPEGRWCHVRDLSDTFDDDHLGDAWTSWRNPGCSIAPNGGALVLRPVTGTTTSCGMTSARPLDMREGELVIEVSELVGPAGVVAKFGIEASGFFAGFSDDGRHLRLLLERDVDVRVVASLAADLVAHRWWRLRAHAGILYWETSRDTLVWVTHAAEPAGIPLEAVEVSTLLVQYQVNPEPRAFGFDNLNAPAE